MRRRPLQLIACLFFAAAVALVAQGLWGHDAEEIAEKRRIAALIEKLGHDSYAHREEANEQLHAAGQRALPALREAAARHPEIEIQQRAERTARTIMLSFSQSPTTELELVLVDPGVMQMGSPAGEAGRAADETQHRVRITRPFLIGKFEVTQEQFRQVMKFNPSWFHDEGGGKDKVARQDTGRFPVESVTWFDAIAFCNQLSENDGDAPYYELVVVERKGDSITSAMVAAKGGSGYRLPTEAEWEHACRGGSATPYHFGAGGGNGNQSNVKGVTTSGGYGGTIVGPNLERTTTVGSYRPNRFGLFDMHGNAAEWCADWYGKDYYATSPEDDPPGPRTGDHRLLRGGSWLVGETSSRSASRLMLAPGEKRYFAGFRVVRSP
jgi:sulfatase modifying factor 1